MKKSWGRTINRRSEGKVAKLNGYSMILIAILRRNEPEGFVFDDSSPYRTAELLADEAGRRLRAIESGGQRLQRFVPEEKES